MEIPSLSAAERSYWESIKDFTEEDLYAILGDEPTYFEPSITPDYLLFGVKYPKTPETIGRGTKRYNFVFEAVRAKICEKWKLIRDKTSSFNQEIIVALIVEAIKKLGNIDATIPTLPTAKLICMYCSYNLDNLCRDYL